METGYAPPATAKSKGEGDKPDLDTLYNTLKANMIQYIQQNSCSFYKQSCCGFFSPSKCRQKSLVPIKVIF